jgi:PKD repeat protein
MKMKKMNFVFLTLLIMMAARASLQAAISYSPPTPKTGETVAFTLSPSGAPVGAISWNFGDGSPVQSGTSLTATHVYAAVGSFTASASYITLNSAIPKIDQATVTVINPRQINFSPPQPKAGQAVAFTALNYYSSCIRWDFGDGEVRNGTATESHTYANAGSYTVRAYEECGGTYGAEVIVTVAFTSPRQIVFSPPQPKAGQAVTFTAQNFFSACIRWDFGDVTIKNGAATESHTYANAGSYTVRAYEECGSTYGAEITVTVAKQDEEPPPVNPSKPTLAVSIINLYFTGGKANVSVAKDFAGLQAFADIQVAGTGILQWQWLVDGMAVKADTLAVSFSNKFSLDSGKVPGLPTSIPGRHLVTLRFQNPKTDFTIPVITYFVGLRGPAPVIRRVMPATLTPGSEYKLDLEGAELTPDTEIVFPAPLALLKKAIILSSTRAQAIVFVPPTAGNGAKAVTAQNEYGQSNGPGQVTIVTRQKIPSDKIPSQAAKSPASPSPAIDQMKTIPRIMGQIDCYPFASPPFADARVQLITNDDQVISNAIVKVDGVLLISSGPTSPTYTATVNLDVPLGHQFTVSVSVNGITYNGTGGKIDNIVQVVKPPNRATINPLETTQIDFQWTYSSGSEPMQLYVKFMSPPPEIVLFSDQVAADHVSVSTSPILNTTGPVLGWLRVFLSKEYAPVVFEGLAALKCKVLVFQSVERPQIELVVSDRKQVPPADSEQALPPKPGPTKVLLMKKTGTTPAQETAAQPPAGEFQTQLNTTPTLNGHITYEINTDPDSSMAARSTFNFSKADGPIADAVIKVDGTVIPPNLNNLPPDYGCQGCYKYEGPWPSIAVGHVTTISISAGGTTYTGSGGPIDSFPQLVKPADGATISLQQTPLLNLQWTGAGGIVPVFVRVGFHGGGGYKELFNGQVSTDHAQVHLNSLPAGSTGLLTVSLTKECNRMIMDGMMRFTSSPHVIVHKDFYLQLVP